MNNKELIDNGIKERISRVEFIGDFIKMASTMKLNVFKEENEWRLISYRPLSSGDVKFQFRAIKSIIAHYYSLEFDLSLIVEIAVGSCRHPDLAQDSIYGLANKYNLTPILSGGVKISSIPYRVF